MENINISLNDELVLLTRRDVSRLLRLGISTVDNIPESDLPRVHFGKSIRYKRKSLIDYINKQEAKNVK